MERWLDEGVDVAGAVFEEFVEDVYQSNALIENDLSFGGRPVDVEQLTMPVLQIVGTYDHLIPPAASKPFNDAIPSEDSEIMEFSSGHVGLSVSSRSHDELWPQVAEWYAERSGTPSEGGVPPDESSAATENTASSATPTDATELSATDTDTGEPSEAVETTVGESPRGVDALVEEIEGVGPTYAERLVDAGYDTVTAIADADREELVTAADAPASRVDSWIEQARSRR
jgi:polyhydroxyalkanoate synthase